MGVDPSFGTRQHLDQVAREVASTSFEDAEVQSGGHDLVAHDATYVCAYCDKRITEGQPMRRRANGGWAHESC